MRAIVIALVVAGCGAPQRGSSCKTVERTSVRGLERWCENPGGTRVGAYERRFPDGALAERSSYVHGMLDGEHASFYAGGAKHDEGRYAAGARDGVWRTWHENGKPWLEGAYTAGAPNGPWREWDYTGALAFEGTYVHGVLDGAWKAYGEDGSVRATGTSVRGALDGVVERRFRDGMRLVSPYKANRMHGTVRVFDKDGKEVQQVEFVDGVEQPKKKSDAP